MLQSFYSLIEIPFPDKYDFNSGILISLK